MYGNLRPPTDSLYKFIAVFGLTLIALGVYVDSLGDIKRAEYQEILDGMTLKKAAKMSAVDALPENSDLFQERFIAEVLRTAEAFTKEHKASELYSNSRILFKIGIVLSLFGFTLWYWKVQRHQDEMLRLQVTKFRSEQP